MEELRPILKDIPEHGAIAVYLCEPESDDGPIENQLVSAAPPGSELPLWRLR